MKRHVWLMGALVGGLVLMGCTANAPTTPTQAPTVVTAIAEAPATSAPVNTEVPASATEPAPPATPEITVAPDTATASVLPAVSSVWNTTIGPDNMTGDCTQGSVLPVYGLVQVTPVEGKLDTIEWKNQEPKPYAFKQVEPNVFSYAGPTSIDDGTVTMTVTFKGETAFTMVRQFVSRADPACVHTHDYAGEFKWTR